MLQRCTTNGGAIKQFEAEWCWQYYVNSTYCNYLEGWNRVPGFWNVVKSAVASCIVGVGMSYYAIPAGQSLDSNGFMLTCSTSAEGALYVSAL